MTARPAIARQLERQSMVTLESTIPGDMTCEQWRRRRAAPQKTAPCDHLHESTSRYDPHEKQLAFLLVCPVCRIEKVIDTRHYEPRYRPTATRARA